MPKNHEKFHSSNGKRLILVADDEMINRELLGAILKISHEVIFAENGVQALEMIREYKDTLSLVLLDILMPVMNGMEVLKAVKADSETAGIPVIVITSEQDAEVESLKLGAIDFIPKPYPAPDVILARVTRTIELSEDRDIIRSTERDELTGLYNIDYFYRYAEQYDQFHKTKDMDAVVLDINHFHLVNERYGKAYGDEVLRSVAGLLRGAVSESEGIVCRREADTFMVYCPHREDYAEILAGISSGLETGQSVSRIRLRMGIYPFADKTIDIERRFDRAKMASDRVRGSFTKTIGIYDETLHAQQLYAEQLIEDFQTAIDENQFTVYYQPKFDVRPEAPLLYGAEALVRWIHPKLGFISPGVFIPLFEENGLIRKLDQYVWRETARQIRRWRDELHYTLPVSVNVSRIDMFDPDLADTLAAILEENGISSRDLRLEVTESAYTQDSGQIIKTVDRLRELGFQIEMDDFGTGYSSLNMISSLPIDALKLDMQFVRSAFREGGNTHMLEIIIDIADYLTVPVIAEGVETAEQLEALRSMGCGIVQGYYFSKPVPAEEFVPFIEQRKERLNTETAAAGNRDKIEIISSRPGYPSSAVREEDLLSAGSGQEEQHERDSGLHLRTANLFFVIAAFAAAIALMIADVSVTHGYQRMEKASDRYISAQMAASDMESGSDYLTDRVRCFVVTGDEAYLDDFLEEVEVTKTRDRAVENLEELLGDSNNAALISLNTALKLSNELIVTEHLAMRLRLEAQGTRPADMPDALRNIEIPAEYRNMTEEELLKEAQLLVFDNSYMHYKDRIRENVGQCTQMLIRTSSLELEQASARMSFLINIQTALTILMLVIVLLIVLIINEQIRKPLSRMVEMMRAQKSIQPTGAEELRFVTRTYNAILKENEEARERLSHEASHDALTGLFNRGAYDMLMESVDTEHMALIIVDVDNFKGVNDTYGHAVGDRVLKRVAEILKNSFRSVDIICRLGGDEFVVVMTRANSSMRHVVLNKIRRANDLLRYPKDDLPPITLSVGAAFSDRQNPQGDIFQDADTALYRAKEAGRNNCVIYE